MSRWHLNTWVLMSSVLWVMAYVQTIAAQVIPDNTLAAPERSQVSGNPNFLINGGARRGGNLFHSFQQFSVPTGGSAFFNNATDVQNILTRVTGGTISNIDGLIRANGTANLFLINPSGIIFGRNASLNIGGSFVASTADALWFSNLGFFSASTPEAPSPLLTINPSALFFNQIAAAPIQNNSTAPAGKTLAGDDAFGLRVRNGKSLLLVGGNISMDGGGLNAFGGQVELGGLVSGGTVGLNVDGNNLSLSFPNVARSDVFLSNGTQVNVFADNGGSIVVNARNLEMTGASGLYAGIDRGLGSNNSKAGDIAVNASAAINLDDGSQIGNYVDSEANGQGGEVSIRASTLRLEGGAQIGAATLGVGKAGNLSIDAQDVQIIGTTSDGRSLSVLAASAEANSTGDAGNLTIKTNTLLVRDGAQIGAGTRGAGKGGNLSVDAQDVQLIGTTADGRVPSGLFASAVISLSTGDAGDLTIKTNTLLVRDGAQVLTATFGPGKGGNLSVDAQDVQIIGISADGRLPSALVAGVQNSPKDAGDLTIKTNTLLLRDGALITVENQGTGTAGNLILNARSIRLDNDASLSANTRSPKVNPNREQATININSQDLILTRNSKIITNAIGANVFGGNININTDALVGIQNSDISANSANFRGGNVRINTQGIVGIQVRDVASPQTSDITATGATRELSGNVQLTRPDVDPTTGLVELPVNFVDNSGLIVQGCPANQGNSFVVTGRGGLPPTPEQQLDDDADWQDRRRITVAQQTNTQRNGSRQQSDNRNNTPHPPLIEANGWQISPTGDVMLIATIPKPTVQNPLMQPVACPGKR